jgi:hypothetical protein
MPIERRFSVDQLEERRKRFQPSNSDLTVISDESSVFSYELGRESQDNVRRALCNRQLCPEVMTARCTCQRGYYDTNLRDIEVLVNCPELANKLWVQVKSSNLYIERGLIRIGRENGLATLDDVRFWLLASKLMFINGQQSQRVIAAQFREQLVEMKDYHLQQTIRLR